MAEFPSLPLFVDAWITDTHHLTRLERGTYLDLLVLMWITPECRVPNDKLWLSKRLNLPLEIIEKEVMPLVCEYCITDGNWITQGRLRQEFQYLRDTHHRQSANAKSRWRKEKRLSQVDASGIEVAYAPTPTPTPTSKKDAAPNGAQFSIADQEKQFFQRGREILGNSSGGFCKKLLMAKAGNVALARAVLETASTKADPREYLGAAVRGRESFDDLRAKGEAW